VTSLFVVNGFEVWPPVNGLNVNPEPSIDLRASMKPTREPHSKTGTDLPSVRWT
jgi:hypothetical protein